MISSPNWPGARVFIATSLVTLFIPLALPFSAGAQTVQWIRQFGTAGVNRARGMATDSTGVYVAGTISGALTGQTTAGGTDAYVRKFDANGNELWTRQFGSSRNDEGYGVAVDSTGVYVVGRTEGAFAGQTSAGGFDAFVRKYDLNGNELWTRQIGSGTNISSIYDSAQGVAANATGVYVVGIVSSVLPGQASLGGSDAFVRKYNADGTEQWTRQFGTSSHEHAYGVAADSTGIYIVGDWGQTATGFFDAFVRKYNADGTLQWARQFGSLVQDVAYGVAADSSGVFVVGETSGALRDQTSAGAEDAFVQKFDATGSELWTRQFGSAGSDRSFAVAADPTGVYVVGETTGALPGQTSLGSDAFVRKYDTDGAELGILQFGSSDDESARGLVLDGTGVYLTGETGAAFPGQTQVGLADAFVIKFSTSFPCAFAITPVNESVSTSRRSGTVNVSAPSGCAWTASSNSSFITLTSASSGSGNGIVSYSVDENTTSNYRTGTLTIASQTFTLMQAGSDGCNFSITPISRTISPNGESGTITVTAPAGCVWAATSSTPFVTITSGSPGVASGSVEYSVAANPSSFTRTAILTIGGESFTVIQGGQVPLPPKPSPAISEAGVVNNATFAPGTAALAPGSIAAVFGSNLNDGSTLRSSAIGPDGKLVTSLGGASVTINGIPAPLFYSLSGQLGVQIPFDLAGQASATIQVTVGTLTSVARTVFLDAFAPGIFTVSEDGRGTAAALHQDNVTPVNAQNPARPGEIIVLFATGLGAVTPPLPTGARSAGNRTVATPAVTIDGIPGDIVFSGAAPGFVGLYQVNVRIPASNRSAQGIPVVLSIGGKQSNSVTIPVSQ